LRAGDVARWVLIITFGWHIFVPFAVLRYADKLNLRESCAFMD
jgi:hypothetical protein